ncbi:MAG: hypothetical protein J5922_03490 [Clostridia bacterium]|nr:hypothetical protein [Clostridia bacterium]
MADKKSVAKRIKVGYLPLYIKLYDDSDPNIRVPVVAYKNKMIDLFEREGIEIVEADEVCRVKDEFMRAVKKFNESGVCAVITQHLAYSPSLESTEALMELNVPLIVFDTTPDYELIECAAKENRIMNNHGIHGVQDMCNLLKRQNKPYYLCVGHVNDGKVINEVLGMCRAAAAAAAYKNMTVGSVGGSFAGMGDFLISDERYKKDIGVNVKYMTPDVAEKYLSLVSDKEIDEEIASDRENYNVSVSDENNYRAASKAGLAVRKWMDDEKIGSATVNFLTLDEYSLPKMPFVECCKMLKRGLGYAGEGDVLTAGLVGALLSVYKDTTFTEMFCPDWKENVILLSHMGESNPDLAQWKPLITDCPFNYNSCGDTVAMYNCYRPGKAVFVNLAPMNEHFNLIISNVELLECGLQNGAYAHATQGWMKPCKPLSEFLAEFSYAGGTHHSAMVYDADISEIVSFGRMMGFDVIEIK